MGDNLEKFDHLVVLMLENRSFDHMLGYLTLEEGRNDVDGLTGNEVNKLDDGRQFGAEHLRTTKFRWDPAHDAEAVADQLADNNGGFVRNFHQNHPDAEPGLIMGYYNKNDLEMFHYLAQEYLICDRWFSSLPGPTAPNRAYAVSGTSRGENVNPDPRLPDFRPYDMTTVFQRLELAGHDWRCYTHDVAWLRIYCQHFLDSTHIKKIDRFYRVAQEGNLPVVSWIEPDYHAIPPRLLPLPFLGLPNDDHPPSDVKRGQRLVKKVYEAIVNSPLREKILFVITYDEHGGFYDHVDPTEAVAADDWPHLRQYGVRVPAIVVSPYVKRGSASSTVFDHTSIVKTILLKFCGGEDGIIENWMSLRVEQANHLGVLLDEEVPRAVEAELEIMEAAGPTGALTLAMVEERLAAFEAEDEAADVEATPSELQEMLNALGNRATAEGLPVERL